MELFKLIGTFKNVALYQVFLFYFSQGCIYRQPDGFLKNILFSGLCLCKMLKRSHHGA